MEKTLVNYQLTWRLMDTLLSGAIPQIGMHDNPYERVCLPYDMRVKRTTIIFAS